MDDSDQDCPIGIDFGTTYSSIGLHNGEDVELVEGNGDDHMFIPTWVAFVDDEWRFGGDAKNLAKTDPTNSISDIKRMLGTPFSCPSLTEHKNNWQFTIREAPDGLIEVFMNTDTGERWVSPVELAGRFLDYLMNLVPEEMRQSRKVVITIPANYVQAQRKAIREAAAFAKLDLLRLVHEPSAAALAFTREPSYKGKSFPNLLVLDLGGGTFDVSLVNVTRDSVEIKAVAGDPFLGGRDFDLKVLDWVFQNLPPEYKEMLENPTKGTFKEDFKEIGLIIAESCTKAKETLSKNGSAPIRIPKFKNYKATTVKMNSEDFVAICAPLFQRVFDPIAVVCEEGRVNLNDLTGILMVGGSSQLVYLQEQIRKRFNLKPLPFLKPREAVARGAIWYSAFLAGKISFQFREIASHSIGVLATVEGREKSFSIMLHKGTPIPASGKRMYSTNSDKQKRISFAVYEGDCPEGTPVDQPGMTRLSDFKTPRFQAKPAGQVSFQVEFYLDEDGVLDIKAIQQDGVARVTRHRFSVHDARAQKIYGTTSIYKERLTPEQQATRDLNSRTVKIGILEYSFRHFVEKHQQELARLGIATSEISALQGELNQLATQRPPPRWNEIRKKCHEMEKLLKPLIGQDTRPHWLTCD